MADDFRRHPGYPPDVEGDLARELRETNKLLREVCCDLRQLIKLLSDKAKDNVDGGSIAQIK
jgi:hypothetical protein